MSYFRTIRVSDLQFSQDGLSFITVKSKNLKGRGDIVVYKPVSVSLKESVPLVILLHGVYGSSWSWTGSGGVHLTAEKLIDAKELPPFVIAMPSDGLWGDGSGYLPHDGFNFEKWIVEDVCEAVGETVPQVTENSPLFIGGLSMGGFGALRIGAKYGSRFRAIAGLSSITAVEQLSQFVEEPLQHYTQSNNEDESLYKTFLTYQSSLPPFRFDCGKNDSLLEANRTLHRQLAELNIHHTYEEFEGEHNWAYWKEHITRTLKFFMSHL